MSAATATPRTEPSRTVYRACVLCEATCGVAITVEGGRVTAVRGDEDDPFSRGYICPKAHGQLGLHEDPDRLRTPVRREGDRFVPISWEEAFEEVGTRLRAIREAHGDAALGTYVGNPNAHDLGAGVYLPALLRALGTKKRFSASSVDQLPKMISSAALFGGAFTIPIPDVDHTDYFLVLGANPLASNGSLMTAPDMRGRLRRLRERGGKLVVIDPRRSETAAIADEHHFIRPGADASFLFALVFTLFDEGLVSLGRLEAFTHGLEELRVLAKDFAPEATAPATGIDAGSTRRIARELAAAKTAVCYGRIGTCTQEFGTLASWLVDVVNVLTGNLDRRGGAMFPLAATSSAAPKKPGGKPVAYARWRSTVRELPEAFGELPVAAMAEEIDSAGDASIRALVTVAGNPVLSAPNGGRLARALESLDFMVSVDIYINETTRFADIILPPNSALERSHYDAAFTGLAVRNVAKFSPPAVPTPEGSWEQWKILAELAGRVNGANAEVVDELVLGTLLQGCVGSERTACPDVTQDAARAALGDEPGPERILDLMLRAGPYGDRFDPASDGLNLARLKAAEHGIDLGPLEPQLPEILNTADGAVDLVPPLLAGDVPRLVAWQRARSEGSAGDGLLLVGRRHVRSNNSWMHNVRSLVKGPDRCTLTVHPDDATRLGLRDGEPARVRSRVGELTAPVEVSEDIMPGVVSLPHGYGHDAPGVKLAVARAHAGVNSNLLTDEALLDELSCNGVLNGIPVEVAPA